SLKAIEGVTTNITVPEVANRTPTLSISWDQQKIKMTVPELRTRLKEGTPSIEVMGNRESCVITAWMMLPGDDQVVASRVVEEFKKAMV
ncbi:MAG: hypothetical protein LBV26_02195, partial [Bacteroidales bacterium]|nr:hypothetical protein [Bacteroidales bacterium]